MEIIYEKTKGQIPLRPSLGKQNYLNQVVASSGFSENGRYFMYGHIYCTDFTYLTYTFTFSTWFLVAL